MHSAWEVLDNEELLNRFSKEIGARLKNGLEIDGEMCCYSHERFSSIFIENPRERGDHLEFQANLEKIRNAMAFKRQLSH